MTFNGRNCACIISGHRKCCWFPSSRLRSIKSSHQSIIIKTLFPMYKIMLKRSVRLPDERPEFNQGGRTEGQMLHVLLDTSLSIRYSFRSYKHKHYEHHLALHFTRKILVHAWVASRQRSRKVIQMIPFLGALLCWFRRKGKENCLHSEDVEEKDTEKVIW